MHSSRMHTASSLIASRSIPRRVCPLTPWMQTPLEVDLTLDADPSDADPTSSLDADPAPISGPQL